MTTQSPFLKRLQTETGLSLDQLLPGRTVIRRYLRPVQAPELRGLHLTIGAASAAGGASFAWSLESVVATGERQRLRVADAKITDLEHAIAKAREIKRDVEAGEDPKALREHQQQKARAAQAAKLAARRKVRELLDVYLAKQQREKRPSAVNLKYFYAEPTRGVLEVKGVSRLVLKPVLGMLDTAVVNVDDVAAQRLVRKYESRGRRMAESALEHLRAAWNVVLKDADQRQAFGVSSNPFQYVRVSEAPDDADDEQGTRALSLQEVKNLWQGLHAETTVTAGNGALMTVRTDDRTRIALLLVLACGQRVQQVLMTRVQDIDLKAKTWTIPLGHRKVRRRLRTSRRAIDKRPHVVPLHPLALDLWRQALALSVDPSNPWLFPAADRQSEEQHEPRDHRTLNRFLTRWCERTAFAHFTPRDLRRTWTTLAAKWRLEREIRMRIQDHAFSDVEATNYDENDYFEPMVEVMDTFGAKLAAEVLTPQAPANVVPIARLAAGVA